MLTGTAKLKFQRRYMKKYRRYVALRKLWGKRFSDKHLRRMAGLITCLLMLCSCRWPGQDQYEPRNTPTPWHTPVTTNLPPALPKTTVRSGPLAKGHLVSTNFDLPPFVYPPVSLATNVGWVLQSSSNLTNWIDVAYFTSRTNGPRYSVTNTQGGMFYRVVSSQRF